MASLEDLGFITREDVEEMWRGPRRPGALEELGLSEDDVRGTLRDAGRPVAPRASPTLERALRFRDAVDEAVDAGRLSEAAEDLLLEHAEEEVERAGVEPGMIAARLAESLPEIADAAPALEALVLEDRDALREVRARERFREDLADADARRQTELPAPLRGLLQESLDAYRVERGW